MRIAPMAVPILLGPVAAVAGRAQGYAWSTRQPGILVFSGSYP